MDNKKLTAFWKEHLRYQEVFFTSPSGPPIRDDAEMAERSFFRAAKAVGEKPSAIVRYILQHRAAIPSAGYQTLPLFLPSSDGKKVMRASPRSGGDGWAVQHGWEVDRFRHAVLEAAERERDDIHGYVPPYSFDLEQSDCDGYADRLTNDAPPPYYIRWSVGGGLYFPPWLMEAHAEVWAAPEKIQPLPVDAAARELLARAGGFGLPEPHVRSRAFSGSWYIEMRAVGYPYVYVRVSDHPASQETLDKYNTFDSRLLEVGPHAMRPEDALAAIADYRDGAPLSV